MQSLEVYARRISTLPAKQYQLDAEAIETFSAYEHDKQVQAQQARLDAQGPRKSRPFPPQQPSVQ